MARWNVTRQLGQLTVGVTVANQVFAYLDHEKKRYHSTRVVSRTCIVVIEIMIQELARLSPEQTRMTLEWLY